MTVIQGLQKGVLRQEWIYTSKNMPSEPMQNINIYKKSFKKGLP
ncbi:hypothetical protein GCM10008986_34430 [Salinibacillus aidingensis]|uniref:Uncharacterized protein n=1 Tax=Salinibacillus aidingensis TaxID=237684 RepID=A0ABP3LPB9_9BACI